MSWNTSVLCLVLIPLRYIAINQSFCEHLKNYKNLALVLFVGLFVLFLNMISMFAQELSCFLFTLLGKLFLQHHLGVLLSCLCSLFWRLFSTKNFDGFIIPVIEYMLFLLFISMQSEHMADSALDFVLFTLIYNK